ncbi:MAG TPA: terminase large subunit, partial [Bacilli bacterium]|nr:terminase large subunit [Bacilli bacterium]
SKTYSILQLLVLIALNRSGLTISVVSESLPHLKKGAMKDFISILRSIGIYSERIHNQTENSFRIGKSIVEFFSAEDEGKVTGPRRDILFMNELNNIQFKIYDQAEVRTRLCVFADFNPTNHFFIHELMDSWKEDEFAFFKSTYLDNLENLAPGIVRSIEARRLRDPDWWKVYGLGEVGKTEGLVFPIWKKINRNEIPDNASGRIKLSGMDFGFTNDPTAFVDVYRHGDRLILDERFYETGMKTKDIDKRLRSIGHSENETFVADPNWPITIAELEDLGWSIQKASKPKGSITSGIDLMKGFDIEVTDESLNLIKELRNYKFKRDPKRTELFLNEPIDSWNHAIDGARYAASEIISGSGIGFNADPKIYSLDD